MKGVREQKTLVRRVCASSGAGLQRSATTSQVKWVWWDADEGGEKRAKTSGSSNEPGDLSKQPTHRDYAKGTLASANLRAASSSVKARPSFPRMHAR